MKNSILLITFLALLLLVSCASVEFDEEKAKLAFEDNAVNIAGYSSAKNSVANSARYVYYYKNSCVNAYDKMNGKSFQLCRDKNCDHQDCVFGEKCAYVLFGGSITYIIVQNGALYEVYTANEDGTEPTKICETETVIRKPICRNDVLYFYSQGENGAEIMSLNKDGEFAVCVDAEQRPFEFCVSDQGICYCDRFGDLYFGGELIASDDVEYVQYFNGSVYYSNGEGVYSYNILNKTTSALCDIPLADWVATDKGILHTIQLENRFGISLFDPESKIDRTVCDINAEFEYWLFDGCDIFTMAETEEDRKKALDECRTLTVDDAGNVVLKYDKIRSFVVVKDILNN